MNDESIIINVRYSSATNIARAKGINKTASSTSCKEDAVKALAKKIMGDDPFEMKQYGKSDTWILTRIESGEV